MPSFDKKVPLGSSGQIANKGTPIARTRVLHGKNSWQSGLPKCRVGLLRRIREGSIQWVSIFGRRASRRWSLR